MARRRRRAFRKQRVRYYTWRARRRRMRGALVHYGERPIGLHASNGSRRNQFTADGRYRRRTASGRTVYKGHGFKRGGVGGMWVSRPKRDDR